MALERATRHLRLVIGDNGCTRHFIDKRRDRK